MNTCIMCGISIPKGQRVCSMCYGDPFYGTDMEYLNWLNASSEEEYRREQYERTLRERDNSSGDGPDLPG